MAITFAIIGCVLAILVPLAAGLVLRISLLAESDRREAASIARLTACQTALERLISSTVARVEQCESSLRNTSGTHQAAEVAALAADVQALAASCRKNFGKVFAELHRDGALKRNAEAQADIETADDARARLRREHGLALAPKVSTREGQ